MYKIIGRGVVESDYYFEDNDEDYFSNFRKVNWTNIGEWDYPGTAAMKTLTDITYNTEAIEELESKIVDPEVDPIATEKTWPGQMQIRYRKNTGALWMN